MIFYIIKSSLSLILLFGLYWFLLRRERLFVFNRVFLIFSIVFSLFIPIISIPINIQNQESDKNIITAINNTLYTINPELKPVIETSNQSPAVVQTSKINFSSLLIILYFSGVLLLVIRFLRNILFIFHQLRLSKKINYSGQNLALIDYSINPYCFFNTIFIGENDYLRNRISKELLRHELVHIKQSHSFDVIFLELIQIFYWFNPILILYNKAVRLNHEYLADDGAIQDSIDIKSYAETLLNFISCKRNIPLTSGSNHSLTKKRLIMITKNKSNRIISGVRVFMTIVLLLIFILFISFKQSNSKNSGMIPSDTTGVFMAKNEKPQEENNIISTGMSNSSHTATSISIGTLIHQDSLISDKILLKRADVCLILKDSINKEVMILTGKAAVTYGDIEIKADSIVLEMSKNQLFASGRLDKSGKIIGNPVFKEGAIEIESDELTYNFKTRLALIKNIKP